MRITKYLIGFLIFFFQTLIISSLYSQGYDWRFANESVVHGAKQILEKSKGCYGKHFDWTVKQEYNENGKLIMQESYFQGKLRSKYLYGYDKNGFDSIFIQLYSINEPNDTLIERVYTKINNQNQLIEYISKPGYENSSIKCYDFKYNLKNNVISYKYFYNSEKGSSFWRFRNVYIKDIEEFKTYRIDSTNIINSVTLYKFDKHGNKKESITTSYYCTNRQQYEDESFEEFINQEDLEMIYEIDTKKIKLRYKYDSKGNWIKKYEKHGLFFRLEEKRKIEY